jgi:hypothetical protein
MRRRIGRPRQTECFAEHKPDTDCSDCRRQRQLKWRLTSPKAKKKRVRPLEDTLATRARAYVWTYLRRGAVKPSESCEICGTSGPLVFWQPNLDRKRELIWLCTRDRDRVAASGQPVTLTWIWPGWERRPDDPVRDVQPTRSPRGLGRLTRSEAKIARAIEAAEHRMADQPRRPPIDEATALLKLEAANRLVDETLARIAAQNEAYEASRRKRLIEKGLEVS